MPTRLCSLPARNHIPAELRVENPGSDSAVHHRHIATAASHSRAASWVSHTASGRGAHRTGSAPGPDNALAALGNQVPALHSATVARQAHGQYVNQPRLMKRTMGGCASDDLLRRRVLAAT